MRNFLAEETTWKYSFSVIESMRTVTLGMADTDNAPLQLWKHMPLYVAKITRGFGTEDTSSLTTRLTLPHRTEREQRFQRMCRLQHNDLLTCNERIEASRMITAGSSLSRRAKPENWICRTCNRRRQHGSFEHLKNTILRRSSAMEIHSP